MAVSEYLFHIPSQWLEEPSWLSCYYCMRGVVLLVLAVLSLVSCSLPVLKSDLLEKGVRDVSMAQLTESPQVYEGKLFILGGVIVSTRLTEKGSLIEAIHIPVSSAGYLKEMQPTTGRYLAFYPKESGVLDPVVYRAGKKITLARGLLFAVIKH
jgi:starvation-inducible outer membrane lipoprotein